MHTHSPTADAWSSGQWIVLLPFAAAAVIYVAAAVAEAGKGRPWPRWRTSSWLLGLGIAGLAMSGTASSATDQPFTAHVMAHLLVGMVAPVFLVLAAPVTLALRSFAILPARRLSRALRSAPARLLGRPVVAALLTVGSLWLLYSTPLYSSTSQTFMHLVVMVHFLAVGFLFTAAVMPIDPSPHRSPVSVRLVVLTLSMAAHSVLSKALYASDTVGSGALAALVSVPGVSQADLQTGAQIMYYGGDLVDLALISLVLLGWYRGVGGRGGRHGRPRVQRVERSVPQGQGASR